MKKILISIAVIAFMQMMFISCEKKANLPWPEETAYGVAATINEVEGEETLIYFNDLDNVAIKFEIGVAYGDFSKLQLMLAVRANGELAYDYLNQYQIAEYSQTGVYTVTIADIVNGVEIYNSTSDIQQRDKYRFFVNVVTDDGRQLYGFLPFDEEVSGYDPNTRANPDLNFFEDFVVI